MQMGEEVNTADPDKVGGVLACRYIILREEQASKAELPILVTLLGIVMETRKEQL